MWKIFFSCLLVAAMSIVMTPMANRLAWAVGAIDVPRERRRMHQRATARDGGIAIFLPFLAGCLLLGVRSTFLARSLIGAAVIFGMGFWDDVRGLPPVLKLSVQVAAAVIGCGASLQWETAASIVWVVTVCNAHNFIDGLDGLFSGCAAVECIALSGMLLLVGQSYFALPVLLLGVACFCFRFYNRHPALIFAGDCGSETVGYLLGMFSLLLFYEMRWSAGWLSPLFLFAYPLTDLISSVMRRLVNGRSPFFADGAHLHHRICAMGVGQVSCGRILIFLSAVFCLVGVCLCTGQLLFVAGLACLIAASLLMELQTFFYSV